MVIEPAESLLVDLRVLLKQLLEVLLLVDIGQQCMEVDDVIVVGGFNVGLLIFGTIVSSQNIEGSIPSLLELINREEASA